MHHATPNGRNRFGLTICTGALLLAGGLFVPIGCSSDNSSTNTTSTSGIVRICIPGAQMTCACPGGVSGVQVCNAEGSGLEPCQCGTGGMGGSAGTGGMGGSAGTGGMGMGGGGAGGSAGTGGMGGSAGTGGMGGGGAGGMGGSSSSSSSSSSGGPTCQIVNPNGGATKFASAYGDAAVQTGTAVVFDKSGNIILGGAFTGTMNLGGTTLTSAGGDDAFVAKFTSAGQLIWAKSFGDAKGQGVSGLGVDPNGNVYVTGNFTGTINFGGGTMSAAGSLFTDVFVAKLNSDGNHMWSQRFGDDNAQNARALAVDSAGNVVVVGYFQNVVNFGGGDLTSAGMFDLFVAKFNTAGTHQWSRRFGDAANSQYARAVAVDAASNVYLAGEVAGAIDFGGGSMPVTTTKSALVAKLDALGNATWVKLSNGAANSQAVAYSVAVGPNGEVATGGYFQSMFDLGGTPVMGAGSDDAFVTLLSATGDHTFTKTFGNFEQQQVSGVAVAPNGDVFAAGDFSGTIDLETGTTFTSAGLSDGFLVRLSTNGCPTWVKTYPGPMAQLTQALALDPTTGGVGATGSFLGVVDFGTGMTTASGSDVFLMSVNP